MYFSRTFAFSIKYRKNVILRNFRSFTQITRLYDINITMSAHAVILSKFSALCVEHIHEWHRQILAYVIRSVVEGSAFSYSVFVYHEIWKEKADVSATLNMTVLHHWSSMSIGTQWRIFLSWHYTLQVKKEDPSFVRMTVRRLFFSISTLWGLRQAKVLLTFCVVIETPC